MKDYIGQVARALESNCTVQDIHDTLTQDLGMSEEDAYLTYIGGKMVFEARQSDSPFSEKGKR